MPRRTKVQIRVADPDPIYGRTDIGKFVSSVMIDGKRSIAERVVYQAFDQVRKSARREPLEVFDQAMRNVTPIIEVKPRRVGGATYQVPVEVRHDRKFALARRWLITSARKRPGKSMAAKLASELLDAANGTGAAVKKREDTHKMAESNKAFSHFRY